MRIQLKRRLHAVLTKSLAHSLDVNALFEKRRVSVSQVVKADLRQRLEAGDATHETPADDDPVQSRRTRTVPTAGSRERDDQLKRLYDLS